MFHVGNFEIAQHLESARERIGLLVYAIVALTLAVLSFLEIIPEDFKFFIFAAWMPPVVFGIIYQHYLDFRQKRKRKLPN